MNSEAAHSLPDLASLDPLDLGMQPGVYGYPGCDAHATNVAWISVQIASALGLSSLDVIKVGAAGKSHDIGKRYIRNEILYKAGVLTPSEWRAITEHPRLGAELLVRRSTELGVDLSVSIEAALFHHERWDGTGYPFNLIAQEIPLVARIVAIADVFDALTTSRPYKLGWSRPAAVNFINRNQGTHFDPACVAAFASVELLMPADWHVQAQISMQAGQASLYGEWQNNRRLKPDAALQLAQQGRADD